ncbi:TrmH family RNA methyltransferase [Candidatus Saccharibacteria bacterium]|nr:TrmH family RNA methyltransferase [Candidatus Saccharibacteria bacterium]
MKLRLVLDNIRSTYNVGAILRTAEGLGVDRVILSGYTPRVQDASLLPHLREKLDREIHKTALGAENLLDIYSCGDIFSELKSLKNQGWQIVGLENNINDYRLVKTTDERIKEKLSDRVVLVLGEEVEGIDHSLYDIIDLFLEIPMKGKKESFNVSVAAGIAIYAIMNL